MPEKSGHIVELQSLRGIAATAVMVGHALVYYDTPAWFHQLATLANGRAAVVVFFVLSGYVLTRSLRNAEFDGPTVLRFYVQRVFRIYPAIWAASGLSLIYIFTLHWQIPVEQPGELILHAFRADRFDALHIIVSLAAMTTFVLPQLWTIFVELVASIAMPGIAFVAYRRKGWFPCMLAIALIISFAIPNTYYHVTMYFMDFIVGAGLAMEGNTRMFASIPARSVVSLGLVVLACTQFLPLEYWSPTINLTETIVATLIIGSLIGANTRIALLRSRFLLLIGDVSFSIYLLHFVVLCTLAKVFALIGLRLDTIVMSVLLAIGTCVVTVPLAWLCFTYVEKPGMQLGKRSLRHIHPLSLISRET